jgi:hypothetical protein
MKGFCAIVGVCLMFGSLALGCAKTRATMANENAAATGGPGCAPADCTTTVAGDAGRDAAATAGTGGSDPQPPVAMAAGTGAPAGAGAAGSGASFAQPPPCASPWYECPELCPRGLVLRGGGRSLAQCAGDCQFELSVAPVNALEDLVCRNVFAELTVRNTDGRSRIASAQLTPAGWERLAEVSLELAAATLLPVSGCPDCDEAGAAFVKVLGSDGNYRDSMYEASNPPPELAAADAFVRELIAQLEACEGPWITNCEQRPGPDHDPDAVEPSCNFTYSEPPNTLWVSCGLTLPVDEPCRAAVTCLCSSDALPPGSSDVQGCVDSWLVPRGAVTFADFCAPDAASATFSLGDALRGLAATRGAQLTTANCEDVPAF